MGGFLIQKEKTIENFDWDSFVEESKKYKASACLWIDKNVLPKVSGSTQK